MQARLVLPFAVLLIVGALSGCVGNTASSDDAGASTAGPATVDAGENAAPTDEVGSLLGTVTDDEAVPIAGVKVAILIPELSATTNENGEYSFLNLKVGTYDVFAERLGYSSRAAKVTIEVGKETRHNFALAPLAVDEAFPITDHYATVLECMVQSFIWVSTCTWPYEVVYLTAHSNNVNLSNYGAPRDIMDNYFRDTVTVQAGGGKSIVSELEWRANTALADEMQIVNCQRYDQITDSCVGTFAGSSKAGKSPITHAWELPKANRPAAGKTFTYISAIWLNWAHNPQDAGLILDQKVDLYNTVFYNGEAPEDFSVLLKK